MGSVENQMHHYFPALDVRTGSQTPGGPGREMFSESCFILNLLKEGKGEKKEEVKNTT